MPRETVPNSPLSGGDVKKIILRHFEDLLANEGLLSEHIAYGRVAFTLSLALHMANPMHPQSRIAYDSRPVARNIVAHDPALAAIEPVPLANPGPDSLVHASERTVHITSPNEERRRHGLPVMVERRQQDGTKTTEPVIYPPDPNLAPPSVESRDTTEAMRAKWNLAPAAPGAIDDLLDAAERARAMSDVPADSDPVDGVPV